MLGHLTYDEQRMYEAFPFKIKALIFSSILYVANKYMIKIADILGERDTEQIREWISRTENNFYKYFLPAGKKLGDDLVSKDWTRRTTISSLLPIYTGLIPKEEIETFVKWITHAHYGFCDGRCHTPALPSTPLEASYFRPMTYWRGPVWVNTNWMIWLGLLKYGYKEDVNNIKDGIIELVTNHGFREYYNPFTGEGLGGKGFSWTAANVIDMIKNKGIGILPD